MKNLALAVVLILGLFGISANLENDTKIGYVYMDLVLSKMPEAVEMNKILEKYSAEKAAKLSKSSAIVEGKIEEMSKKEKAGELTEAGRIIAENEIANLKMGLEKQTTINEQELYEKRVQLLTPIAKKLEASMDKVAAKLGYKYVLNSSDGTGNSIVIVAPEADDLTQEVMEDLEIRLD
ncbi:MAG: OmpH family outer membrane protein [Flavobacteriales bacterium]|nr:OmpH family outer membrane protein [Flavobacteriales bacterium]